MRHTRPTQHAGDIHSRDLATAEYKGPKCHINIRISVLVPRPKNQGDTRNYGVYDLYVYLIFTEVDTSAGPGEKHANLD